jgi:hypothetical protein
VVQLQDALGPIKSRHRAGLSVSEFNGSLKFGRWRIRQIFKNSVKTEKFGRNEVEPWKEQKNFKNPKFSRFDQIIHQFDQIIGQFSKNSVIFEKGFGPLRRFD